jgi:hypothetical protein
MERYDTRYAAILVNVSSLDKATREIRTFYWVLSFLSPLFWPLLVSSYVPEKQCTMIFGVLDMQENKVVYGNIINFNTMDRSDLLKSQLYGIFATLKHKKK